MVTHVGERVTEPVTGVEFDRHPIWDAKPYLLLGIGVRKVALGNLYAIRFAVEREPAERALERWFVGEGRRHGALRGPGLAEALDHDGSFWEWMLAEPFGKWVELAFHHGIAAEHLRGLFRKSLMRILGPGAIGRIDAVVGDLDRDLQKSERLGIHVLASWQLAIDFDGRKTHVDPDIARAALRPWLGVETLTPSLRHTVAEGIARLRL
jgi:hypothetical protein